MFFFFFVCICNIYLVHTIRILGIFPVPFYSHQSVFKVVTQELARRGHSLVILTPFPEGNHTQNIKEINVQNISNKIWDEGAKEMAEKQGTLKIDPIVFWSIAYKTMARIVDAQFSCEEMEKLIQDKNENFDLILLESAIRTPLIISARFKAPVIHITSFYGYLETYNIIGAPIHPILYSDYHNFKGINSTIIDKIQELYRYAVFKYIDWKMEQEENRMIQKHFGVNAPSISELKKNVYMSFINVHHMWDNNRPVPPSVLYLGALHIKPVMPLPQVRYF